MTSYEAFTAAGTALAELGLALKMKALRSLGTAFPEQQLSKAQAALSLLLPRPRPSPPPSLSPLTLRRPHSALSLDLSVLSAAVSTMQQNTDRVERMSARCQALERKAQHYEMRQIRRSQVLQEQQDESQRRAEALRLEAAHRRKELEKAARLREKDVKEKKLDLLDAQTRHKVNIQREERMRKDELLRSAARSELTRYSQARTREIQSHERKEKAADWREFVEAKRKVSREERENYEDRRERELKLRLTEAVSRHQRIVSDILKTGYVHLSDV